ncbi:MAG: hypothetical protein D6690_13455 [Nitrospirae bacterium]|nr:MAG: hypothetical protein D6690_13455 [Nitrospirota bacterium]
MSVSEDIYKTLKGLVGLQDQMKRIEKNLSEMAPELRHHRDRLVRLETKFEVYEQLAQKSRRLSQH